MIFTIDNMLKLAQIQNKGQLVPFFKKIHNRNGKENSDNKTTTYPIEKLPNGIEQSSQSFGRLLSYGDKYNLTKEEIEKEIKKLKEKELKGKKLKNINYLQNDEKFILSLLKKSENNNSDNCKEKKLAKKLISYRYMISKMSKNHNNFALFGYEDEENDEEQQYIAAKMRYNRLLWLLSFMMFKPENNKILTSNDRILFPAHIL